MDIRELLGKLIESTGWTWFDSTSFSVAVLLILLIVASFVVGRLVYISLKRPFKNGSLFLAGTVQLVLIVYGLYGIALYAGIDPTMILAAIAIITAGISLAADGVFASFIGGLKLVITNPFDVGDYITVDGTHGQIKSIGLLSTVMHASSKGVIVFSNKTVSDTTIINHTRLGGIEVAIMIPMFDTHDIKSATERMKYILKDKDTILPGTKVLYEWTGSGEGYNILIKVKDYSKRKEVASDITTTLTSDLRDCGYPIGVVSFYKNV